MREYQDLHEAIERHALKRAEDGYRIIRHEASSIRDPLLFDFRALMLQPAWLHRYAEIFWDVYGGSGPFQVGGLETAGIPLVTAIVMKGVERGTPVNGFYIRKSRKRSGLMKYIEGTLTDDPVIFVDDLMNTGRSIEKQLLVLADAKVKVSDVFVMLLFRDRSAYGFLAEKNIRLTSLFSLADFGVPLTVDAGTSTKDSFEEFWRYRAPSPSFEHVVQKSAPILDDERIYFGCDDGKFRALWKKNGLLAWEFAIGRHPEGKGIFSTPARVKDVIFFGAYDGVVYALDTESGREIWRNERADWVGSSPDVAPELGIVYIGLEFGLWQKNGGIIALDIATGKERWFASHAGTTHGSPLYIPEEGVVVIGSNDGILYCYDAMTGTLRWRHATGGAIKARASYDSAHRAVIFGNMNGILYAISAKDATVLTAIDLGIEFYSIPLVHGDTVFTAGLDKYVTAYDSTTWKTRWSFATNGRIFASPVLAHGSLWVGSNDGRLYELDPKSGTEKSYLQVSERIVNRIAFDTERLYVPTVANEIYCVGKKAPPPEKSRRA